GDVPAGRVTHNGQSITVHAQIVCVMPDIGDGFTGRGNYESHRSRRLRPTPHQHNVTTPTLTGPVPRVVTTALVTCLTNPSCKADLQAPGNRKLYRSVQRAIAGATQRPMLDALVAGVRSGT
ncbi:hypothetical protein N9V91_05590, partial [Acidimicrobiaceae bacterium]|nr:hypothetical protein [Acidimicrobiaceae bacterium]